MRARHTREPQDCRALSAVLARVADKWTVLVVGLLSKGPMRFNEILRTIEGISQRMLTATLRGLERDGLVTRIVYPRNPQRVDYALTDLGRTLIEPLVALGDWARSNRSTVEEARRKFDAMPRRRQHGGNHATYPIGCGNLRADKLESVLTPAGRWRDDRWGLLLDALLRPGGLSRVAVTSRIHPEVLPASAEVISIPALPRDEALSPVRELPNLSGLLDGTKGVTTQEGRDLVRRTLCLVQGHPKLIELAEGLAADPKKLAAQLDRAAKAQGGQHLDAFFQESATRYDAEAFLDTLRQWTGGVAGTLPEATRVFFHFLCALEEGDREGWLIEVVWPAVWEALGHSEPPPELGQVTAPALAVGLVEKREMGSSEAFALVIHPGVAEAGRADAGAPLRSAVNATMAAFWRSGGRQ